MNKEKYKQLQKEMAQKVNIPSSGSHFKIKKHQLIFTFDIQYLDNLGFVAVDVMSYSGEQKGIFTYKYDVTVEYESGYFAFREGPLLKQALEELIKNEGLQPSLLVIDGHGTAHPRKLGVASWLGVQTGFSSIGVAKRALLKIDYKDILGNDVGDIVKVKLESETVGYVLRSQTDVKPIFVSAGHEISQEEALRMAKKLRGEYRILEPVRRADKAARDAAKIHQGLT